MITENERMLGWMTEAAERLCKPVPLGILQHDRRILTPLDDSIVRIVSNRRPGFSPGKRDGAGARAHTGSGICG